MEGLIYILLIAGFLFLTFVGGMAYLAHVIKREMRRPVLPLGDRDLPSHRVITHPGGQFTVDDPKGRRSPVYNDDDTLWRLENNQG